MMMMVITMRRRSNTYFKHHHHAISPLSSRGWGSDDDGDDDDEHRALSCSRVAPRVTPRIRRAASSSSTSARRGDDRRRPREGRRAVWYETTPRCMRDERVGRSRTPQPRGIDAMQANIIAMTTAPRDEPHPLLMAVPGRVIAQRSRTDTTFINRGMCDAQRPRGGGVSGPLGSAIGLTGRIFCASSLTEMPKST